MTTFIIIIILIILYLCFAWARAARRRRILWEELMAMEFQNQKRSKKTKDLFLFNMNGIGDSQKTNLHSDNEIIDITGKEEYKIDYTNMNHFSSYQPPEEILLGNFYKDKMGLNRQEVAWLNRLGTPTNVFLSIPFCCAETIKLYLAVLKEFQKDLKKGKTTLNKQIEGFKGEIEKIEFEKNRHLPFFERSYITIDVEASIFSLIFKRAENAVREAFYHKRMLPTDFVYADAFIQEQFAQRIEKPISLLIEKLKSTIAQPNEECEIELNIQNVNRWKLTFLPLCENFNAQNKSSFIEQIYQLGRFNLKNPNVESLFLEVSKFIAPHDKIESLTFYLHYLHYNLQSQKSEAKQLSKTTQKQLFKSKEEPAKFQEIVDKFLINKDLDKAISEISVVYAPKRKKIQLDSSIIKEVHEKHSGTVDILNEYLSDEIANEVPISLKEIKEEVREENKITETIVSVEENSFQSFISEIKLSPLQISALQFFELQHFTVSSNELDTFAKSKGALKNALIEGINDVCYEYLDDLLIEEEEEMFVLNEEYYHKILAK